MGKIDPANTVIVFDLDDTLYAERDYQTSGIKAVTAQFKTLYGRNIEPQLLLARDSGVQDIWGLACELLKLPDEVAESMLWTYRLHSPVISLATGAFALVSMCRKQCQHVAVLTDGRAVTQRLKLKALGLADLGCYISEEHGSKKPDDLRFRTIMVEEPAEHYVYIADNPIKDFIAPNALGWTTVGLTLREGQVHSYNVAEIALHALPRHWVDDLTEVPQLLDLI